MATLKTYDWLENDDFWFDKHYPENEAPKACGLYLIGSTYFDPILNKQYYWIKVGMSSNLRNRIRNYYSTNPMVFVIDFRRFSEDYVFEEEAHCQHHLNQVGTSRFARKSCEWFLVDKEDYMNICKKGFKFFY